MKIEIIASTIEDCMNIEKGGANRIELVSALSEGGLTPSIATIKKSVELVNIPVAVMIRPLSNTFNYEKLLIETMKEDIEIAVQYGVEHIVTGVLNSDGYPSIEAINYMFSDINQNINLTFHRAIDSSKDALKSLDIINSCSKITHILTSGGKGKAIDNIDTIEEMIKNTDKTIVIGSGVKASNINIFIDRFKKYKNVDIHIGTDMRFGEIHKKVDINLVSSLINSIK